MHGLGRMMLTGGLGLLLAGCAGAQTMTEFGAVAAGTATGGVAGKQVSDGINTIFGKLDKQTKAAAKQDSKQDKAKEKTPQEKASSTEPSSSAKAVAPISSPASSSPAGAPSASPARASRPAPARVASSRPAVKREEPVAVPDPPPPAHVATVARRPEPPPAPKPAPEPVLAPPPPPPPPEVSAQSLQQIEPGATREDVLKLGPPSTRITMFGDDGHLLEIYDYISKNITVGVVRLSDGEVSKVEVR